MLTACHIDHDQTGKIIMQKKQVSLSQKFEDKVGENSWNYLEIILGTLKNSKKLLVSEQKLQKLQN